MPKLSDLPVPLPRLALTAAVTGVIGLATAAAVNVAAARFLTLPDDAEPLTYTDAAAPEAPAASGSSEADAPVAAAEVPDRPAPRPRAPNAKTWDVIVRRNIFDSSAVYNPQAVVPGGGDCRESSVKLMATMVADIPEYSSALISLGGGKDARAQGFVVGDDIAGEGRITSIDQKKVCTDGGACICMGNDSSGPAKADAAGGGGDEAGGITKLSDTKFQVDQSVIDGAMGNLEQLASQLHASPHKGPDGQVDGYRLSAIRKGSLLERLGVKNGDIVKAVNGKPLTSTEGAMSLYSSMSSEKSFSFDITRRSQDTTLEYEIR